MAPARRRALLALGSGALLLAFAAAILYETSGIGEGSRRLPVTLARARRAGLQPDAALLVRRERTHPNRAARLAYDAALQSFYLKHKGGSSRPSAGERRVMRPAALDLAQLSLAASGATVKDWRRGLWVRFPEGAAYRRAVRSLVGDARARREAGDPDGAARDLRSADDLAAGLRADAAVIPSLILIAGSRLIADEAAALLSDPRLSPAGVRIILAITGGPTFRHDDDRLLLSHELAMGVATILGTARADPRQAIAPGLDPVDRLAPLGRVPAIRRAWAERLVAGYADAAEALPQPWTDFPAYGAAYARLAQAAARTGGVARVLLDGTPERYPLAQIGREARRRTLAHAARLRLGDSPPPPRDPFGSGGLTVRPVVGGTLVLTVLEDGRDDGGARWDVKAQRGDFAVLVLSSPHRTAR